MKSLLVGLLMMAGIASMPLSAYSQPPKQCVSFEPCTVLISPNCSANFTARKCIDESRLFDPFTTCVFGQVGSCVTAGDEVIKENSGYIAATGGTTGGQDRACIVPGVKLTCWKKRSCSSCELRGVLINGTTVSRYVCVGSGDFTDLEAYGFYELEGSCSGGGGSTN